jgi:endonuclease/exonuclease/phosphatase family metal-dependent hydrolase
MDHSRLTLDELEGLKTLRRRIDGAGIPSSTLDESINVATWNIRHWGQKRRKRCSLHYIAEILGQFDLIAVTELRRDVSELTDGPRKKNRTTGQYVPKFNWWRKPYIGSFKAGSFDFALLAVHLQWGTMKGRSCTTPRSRAPYSPIMEASSTSTSAVTRRWLRTGI